MNFRKLVEELVDGFKDPYHRGAYREIFSNPSSSELGSFEDEVRVIIDANKKKVYVFHYQVLHEYACRKIGIKYDRYKKDHLYVTGRVKGAKVKLDRGSPTTNPQEELFDQLRKDKGHWSLKYVIY